MRHGGCLRPSFPACSLFNVYNARVETDTAFNARIFSNRLLWAAVGGALVLPILAVHWPPAQRLFDTTPLTPVQWALAAGAASLILWLEEARKLVRTVARGIRRSSRTPPWRDHR